jgi:glycosyltransferase involved in cell wall biosynthesis
MIVVVQSLDVSIASEKVKGSFEETKKRYDLFAEIDDVALLTQDYQNFSQEFSRIAHVPCAFSESKIISKVLLRFSYLRWLYFFLKSSSWLIKHRKSIKVLISENIDSPAPLIVSMLFKIPYVIYYRYDVGSQVKWINRRSIIGTIILGEERFAFKRVKGLWVTSPHLASTIKDLGRKKRITLIPNWITPPTLAQNKADAFCEKQIGPAILFVGRLHPVKQVDLLVKAFYLLHEKDSQANLYLLGDGPEQQNIRELANNFGLAHNVHLLGFVDRQTVMRMMKRSNVFVLCSKIEGNPRSLIEAMMCKIPIVAANVPGVRDIVQHEKTGYLVNYPEPEELAKAIEYVLKNKRLSKAMVNSAYAYAIQNFSKENALKKIRQELSLLIS